MDLTLGFPERCWVEAVARFAFGYESFFHDYRQTSSNLKEELCVASRFLALTAGLKETANFCSAVLGFLSPK